MKNQVSLANGQQAFKLRQLSEIVKTSLNQSSTWWCITVAVISVGIIIPYLLPLAVATVKAAEKRERAEREISNFEQEDEL